MLKRKTPLRAKAPMARKPIKPRRRKAQSARQKDVRFRSESYLAWVRTQPCVVCGATTGIAAHHMIGMYQLSGMGLKAPDSFAMPACDPFFGSFNDCHQQIHSLKALRDQQPRFLITTLEAAIRVHSGEKRGRLVTALELIKSKEVV